MHKGLERYCDIKKKIKQKNIIIIQLLVKMELLMN